jgi:SAM-dependent methyltransferase
MDLRQEHQRLKEFWNRRTSKRVQATSQFRYQYDFYERYKKQLREPFLDVGCGDGELLEFLIKDGRREVYGVDISEAAIQLAKERLHRYLGDEVDARLKIGDMIYLSQYYDEGFFNTIICEGTFHQTTYTGANLTAVEIYKVLSDDGLAYVSVRSDSTPPKNADLVDGERETHRLRDEDGVVRCYFSEQGFVSLVKDRFEILELEEKELLTRIEKQHYKMRIVVMRKK